MTVIAPASFWSPPPKVHEDTLNLSQATVLNILREHGPMTDDRLVLVYPAFSSHRQTPSGIRTRRRELADLGFVEDSGYNSKTLATGRSAIVWKAVGV